MASRRARCVTDSTVSGDEMRQNLARVISLAGFRDAMSRAEPAESQASEAEVVEKVVGGPADAVLGS